MLYLLIGVVLLLPVAILMIRSALAAEPKNLGVTDGRLAPCPASPNCVSSQCESGECAMEPIPFSGDPHAAMDAIKTTLDSLPRVSIVTEDDAYLHAVVRSAIFRFPDDVEFLVDAENQRIHFRSASRVGYSDLGANRARMTRFRERFEQEMGANTDPESASAHGQTD